MSDRDDITPDMPEDEGLTEPELAIEEIEGARLLGNEARARLRADGFTDEEIDAWADTYYAQSANGRDEGDVEGLVAFIAAEQAAGRSPA
jgi:hypothetical protein